MKPLPKPQFWFARFFTSVVGICSIAWAISVLPAYRAEINLADSAHRILSGASYNVEQLNALRRKLDAIQVNTLRSTALNDAEVIRLKLAEAESARGGPQFNSDLANLQTVVAAAIAGSPSNSFLWLTEYLLQNQRGDATDNGLKFLRMSYLLGPNESWIAIRRNPIALRAFSSLPPEMADQALSEFAGLIRSDFYQEASDILAGPGWAIHEKLLGRLVQVGKVYRSIFARVLASKNLEGAVVPGVELNERRSRPF